MNSIFNFIGTFASILSIPLAIYFYLKSSDARQNRIRLDIIRSISYRIGEGAALDKSEVSAVFNSKLREYNVRKPYFSETTILEDIIADAVSNPFLESSKKTQIILSVGNVLESYLIHDGTRANEKSHETKEDYATLLKEKATHQRQTMDSLRSSIFMIISSTAALLLTTLSITFEKQISPPALTSDFSIEAFISVLVSIIAGVLSLVIVSISKKNKKGK